MNDLKLRRLLELAGQRDGWHVSILLPTHPASPEGQQDIPRLKNLINRADETLIARGMRAPDARDFLRPARDLLDENALWGGRQQGLALFVTKSGVQTYRIPFSLDEELAVDQRFHVRQLLPMLDQGDCYVLALSRNHVRLLRATRFAFEVVTVDGMPANMEQALNLDGADRGEQVHAGAQLSGTGSRKQAAVFHGQGGHADTLKDDIESYFRLIVHALGEKLRGERIPLILAAVAYELPIFRGVCDYPHLAQLELPGNFDHASDAELYERASPLIVQLVDQRQAAEVDRYQQLVGEQKASDDLVTILTAVHEGRVDTLFVERGASLRGSFDVASRTLTEHSGETADDLLDLAATLTLQSGANVLSLERSKMPSGSPIAAILRY